MRLMHKRSCQALGRCRQTKPFSGVAGVSYLAVGSSRILGLEEDFRHFAKAWNISPKPAPHTLWLLLVPGAWTTYLDWDVSILASWVKQHELPTQSEASVQGTSEGPLD